MTQTLPFSRRGLLGGLVSSLALAACNPVRYAAPRAELAAEFAANSPARRAAANAWWAAFRDKRLDALIAAGLKRNLDVQTAVATIREAQANARLVGASDLPQVDAQGSAARSRDERGVFESDSATLGVSWLVDLFGSTRAARQGASARLDAAYLSAEVARLTVASAIASAYVDARYYQEALALTRQSLESRRRTLEMTRTQDAFGSVSRLEVLQAEQLVAQAEAALPGLEVGFDQSVNRLATLTAGRSADLAAELRRGGGQPRARYSASVGVPADVVRVRPDVRMAERNLAAAAADVGEARAAFYPRLTLSGSITPTNGKSWSFGPQISLPLFSGGANQARLSAAEARAEQARLAWQAAVLGAVEEVENALAGYNRDARAVAAQSRLVENARETVNLTRSSYELGEADFFPVLDAERSLLSARQELAAAIRQQALNFVALSAAAAGGVGLPAA
ncbi:efflux transporter outer membrane subunit [Paracoccus sp. P2]|uniref:Efflux transporter outer membrane subunit n=1 Tax=Paracoccus pantotrophus TaxID=82367 RepID=A0A1I5MKV3_PARPN|nr:efflux transporter outer membrane subunit [Paracoccus pantotrophus]MDF3856351.1 efflux transporter outer membrane subunit [Paracoccus pantotrophus]QFG35886.1 efflux transporter outer membrane subunit [Paracoccus pantotrophus]QLH12761.1 efflux transporter outer membrane subunit [Paracoccus pantotrophus]RKS43853.1 multidrug efflux system outer membrane protein [Paracoccus pantotrophus]RNI17918.1 efflux transporter outer membrane subunit [Paracoccus pantotrophus]